ncbi:DUF2066 domain-containing protein [Maricaulis sp. CAU 1757]
MRFLVAALSLVIFSTGSSRADDVFTVIGVPIDATASNALEAQTAAMQEGQYAAARRIIERLSLPEDRVGTALDTSLPLQGADIAGLIAGFEITNEQRSATRYLARLNVNFDPAAVRRIFRNNGIPFVEAQARPRLVLPIYGANDGLVLWEDSPWREAWAQSNFRYNLTPMVLADAERGGAPLISVRQALDLDEVALRDLASMYGVSRLAILRAAESEDARRVGGYLVDIDAEGSLAVSTWGPVSVASWEEAARMFVGDQELAWKQDTIVRDLSERELRLTVFYSSLADWRGLQSVIAGTSLIADAQLDALSRDGALMTIRHRGDRAQLAAELAERGAALEEQPGLGWVVTATR